MPVVVLRAADLGVTGYESCAELEANAALRETLEKIRLAAGPLMNLGDVATTTVPKLTLVPPRTQAARSPPAPSSPTAATTPSACSAP